MKKGKLIMLALLLSTLVAAAAAMAGGTPLPPAEAKAVYDYLTKESPYQNWPLFPGTEKMYSGQRPHGALITTYVSPDTLQAIQNGTGTLPDGAFIVKENYMPDRTLDAVTVMYRVAGYNPDAGDWFWAKYSNAGGIDASGKVAGCIGCHASAADNDWVMVGPVK